MGLVRMGLTTLMLIAFGGSLMGGNLVTNGSFESSLYTVNHEFDPTFNSQGVSGWTGTGYDIYFFAGTQTTVSAINQWNSTKEMLGAAAAGHLSPDGGNFVALDADPNIASTITQSISGLKVGVTYVLTFSWATAQLQSRTGITHNNFVQVSLGNSAAQNTTSVANLPSQGFAGWFSASFSFVANNSTETLKFLAKSTSTCLPPMILLDGVSLKEAVPEPGTVTMFAVGTVLILGAAVRRRRPRN